MGRCCAPVFRIGHPLLAINFGMSFRLSNFKIFIFYPTNYLIVLKSSSQRIILTNSCLFIAGHPFFKKQDANNLVVNLLQN